MNFLQPRLRAGTVCLAICLAAATIVSPACAADITITVTNFAFAPQETIVTAGSKVIFRNDDDTIHSVVADDGSFHSPALDTGGTFDVTFTKAGTIAYHCGLHPFMQGKIVVR